jgi:hypothetical protein
MNLGTVHIVQELVARELRSARPDAPVVPDRTPVPASPRLRRTRTVTATALRRAAARVAPA